MIMPETNLIEPMKIQILPIIPKWVIDFDEKIIFFMAVD